MNHNGKPINQVTGWNDPPKDGKDHPVFETGQRERPAEKPEPIQRATNEQRRIKYMLAMRALRKAEGTWPDGMDALLGIEGLE